MADKKGKKSAVSEESIESIVGKLKQDVEGTSATPADSKPLKAKTLNSKEPQAAPKQAKPVKIPSPEGVLKKLEQSDKKSAETVSEVANAAEQEIFDNFESNILTTTIDQMIDALVEKKSMAFDELAKRFEISQESVEKIGLVLERNRVVDVQYPTVLVKRPRIVYLKELPLPIQPKPSGKLLGRYGFEINSVPVAIITHMPPGASRPAYFMSKPLIRPYTEVFLDELKNDISEKIPIELSEVTDAKKAAKLRDRFFRVAKQELSGYLKKTDENKINILAGLMLHSMYGLGDIELLMGDDNLEEIAVNSSRTPLTVYHKKYGWLLSNVKLSSEGEISNYSAQIGRKVGREITTLSPILDAHLVSGDRVNATLAPISSFGNTITIRRFARRPWTVADFIGASHTMNLEMAALLWMAMHYEMNVLVAGGTASGKTSTLNVLSSFIPSYHRIISIEDVREIMLPKHMHWNWVPMTTRNANPEGLGEVPMLELMQSSLRMRPDRIIVGEMRRQREAEVLFEAMHTGHSVYSTIHANSSQEVIRRLTEPPMRIPALQVESIDLLLVQYRDRRRNIRRTYELSEIEAGISESQLSVNTIFKWDPRSDEWESLNPASKFVRVLNMHTGMTEEDIANELKDRAQVLKWLIDQGVSEINDVGKIMALYYSSPELVKKVVKKDAPVTELPGF